jgi:RNA polymerase sigma-70 factor (ECF subfamily)
LICQWETPDEVLAVPALCILARQERFLLYALHNSGYAEVTEICGCSKYAARNSIVAVRKVFETFFRK